MKFIIKFSIGNVIVKLKDLEIVELLFTEQAPPADGYYFPSTGQRALYERISTQLGEFFSGRRKEFKLNFLIHGSDFEQRVYREVMKIPYGETISYKELARRCYNPKAIRAVGNALAKNHLLLLIPCHRVIGSDGKLHGYRGGAKIKLAILDLESKFI